MADFEAIGSICERVLRDVAETQDAAAEVFDEYRVFAPIAPAPSVVARCLERIGRERLLRLVRRIGFEGKAKRYAKRDRLWRLVECLSPAVPPADPPDVPAFGNEVKHGGAASTTGLKAIEEANL